MMTPALKKSVASASLKAKSSATANTSALNSAKSKEIPVLNTQKDNAFNRFLEASCDCV